MMLADSWMWTQLCRLGGVGISAHQATAHFDMDFSSQPLQLGSPQRLARYQKWPSRDGLASCECQTALWLCNEAIRQSEPPLLQLLLELK